MATGATERVDRFDNHQQFWISPSSNKAVVLGPPSDRKEGGATMGVYDLATGQETTLKGIVIGYPSEGIPRQNIQTSPIDARFAWADFGQASGVAISEAALDGSQATLLDELPQPVQRLSSDGLVLYATLDTTLVLRDTKTGAETIFEHAEIGAIAPVVAGRS